MKKGSGLDASSPPSASGMTIAAVVSRFNPDITDSLLEGARLAFVGAGGSDADLHVVRVPGAFELPQAVQKIASGEGVDGILTLGCLIKGETLHFDVLSHSVTQTLTDLSIRLEVPLAFGLLTALDREQAIERARPVENNRGAEVMLSLIEMIAMTGSQV